MKLHTNTYPYRLELGYELGFGPSVFDFITELILTFREPGQDILFLYTNWNRELDPHRDEMIEISASSFHAGIIYDPNQAIRQRVMEVLSHHSAPNLKHQVNSDIMDELFSQFIGTAYKELDKELLLKIGAIVHEMNSVYSLEDLNEITQAFVNDRLVYNNCSWLLPYDRPDNLKSTLWYRANTKEEIKQSFELTDWWFNCVILNEEAPVEGYDYFLHFTEEHGDDHDGMVLQISRRSTDHFEKVVLPRLQELIK
ncbi:hypothetical protein PCCS19_00320 [Paenibacillus sp. CCS19]|uniref:hypothetical protein n=1 Tax=Paenibacillus sp. CCS19 TaxID=3158387 RepID=UPI00256E587F|nr:hypothetical protein [Paenibacillus cellulosilyticus]GMK36979.1 hypothetical protein PCCS19_00320 [Paenibacillus cellulosilyticus]